VPHTDRSVFYSVWMLHSVMRISVSVPCSHISLLFRPFFSLRTAIPTFGSCSQRMGEKSSLNLQCTIEVILSQTEKSSTNFTSRRSWIPASRDRRKDCPDLKTAYLSHLPGFARSRSRECGCEIMCAESGKRSQMVLMRTCHEFRAMTSNHIQLCKSARQIYRLG
jgi:hypothetical protein